MYRAKVIGLAALAAATIIPMTVSADNKRQSFEEFRKGILSDYNEFKQTLLDRYADFLNGEWHEYESLNAEKRDRKPKPREVPSVTTPAKPAKPVKPTEPAKPVKPAQPVKPSEPDKPQTPVKPAEPVKPATPEKPAEPVKPSQPADDGDSFSFYTIPMVMPQVEFNISDRLYSNNDYASHWRKLDKADVASRLLPYFNGAAKEMNLNDYLTFQLMKHYVDARFPQAHESSRISTLHYLLANAGFDVRLATTGDGIPLLLIPFDQTIYGRTFLNLDGKKYYIFPPDSYDVTKIAGQRILTCRLPDDVNLGKEMGLTLSPLRIPFKAKQFDLSYGPLHLTGEVNENLIPILYRYPQMPVSGYALSDLQPQLRREIASQISSQLAGMTQADAVEALLQFTQHAFDYSIDEDNHGFEKPYFIEETLYYPANDCEDRAIFYTYFLWNALSTGSQLISFPGHESASVTLPEPLDGASYNYRGTTYYISDPTYIGARTGMVMPAYKNDTPTVDFTYE